MTPIQGWRALEDFTGLKEHRIRRAIGHYGFPNPKLRFKVNLATGRSEGFNCWSEKDVVKWMTSLDFKTKENIYGRAKEKLDRTDQKGSASPRVTCGDGSSSYVSTTLESEVKGWTRGETSAVCNQCEEVE